MQDGKQINRTVGRMAGRMESSVSSKRYVFAKDIDEATKILKEAGGRAVAAAGGTSLALRRLTTVDTLVDITHAGLNHIEFRSTETKRSKPGGPEGKKRLVIGAAATMEMLASHPSIVEYFPALSKAARSVGSTQIRNAATLGGSLYMAPYWADMPAVIMAYHGRVVIAGDAKEREVLYADLIKNHPSSALKPWELIKEVVIPMENRVAVFEKFSRTKVDYALFDAAVSAVIENGVKEKSDDKAKVGEAKEGKPVLKDVLVAFSGATLLPVMLGTTMSLLEGKRPTRDEITAAVTTGLGRIQFRQDIRAGEDYRREVASVVIRRLIEDLLSKMEGC